MRWRNDSPKAREDHSATRAARQAATDQAGAIYWEAITPDWDVYREAINKAHADFQRNMDLARTAFYEAIKRAE